VAKNNILLRSKKKKAKALLEANRFEEAATILSLLSRSLPMDVEIWLSLGMTEGKQGNHAAAAKFFHKAVLIQPANSTAQYNLGVALRDSGDLASAIPAFERATQLNPGHGEAFDCLAHAYMTLGNLDSAIKTFQAALAVNPSKAETHSNLGSVYQAKGLLGEAEACYRKAIELKPDISIADNLGSVLGSQGRFEEALDVYRKGLDRQPGNERLLSNYLLTLNYLPGLNQGEVFREHEKFNELLLKTQVHTDFPNAADAGRRLKVAYVSPDFREHSVAYFIQPVLEGHNRSRVEVYGYSAVPKPDKVTAELESACDNWCDVSSMGPDQVAARIRQDEIDILVDLAGHTAHNLLAVFARRPAPIQATWLGYPNTTGLKTIHYRITDPVVDPPGQDLFYTEKLVRLQGCFLCYKPPKDAPPLSSPPALSTGKFTFGSFNNLSKINDRVIRLWSDLIKAVPNSRLLLKNSSLTDERTRQRYQQKFLDQGLGKDDVELMGHTRTRQEHLALYDRVDIGLDSFPYNGTTTTCEALWMGVPVLNLSGSHHAARVGSTLLRAVGLEDWVAESENAFIEKAIEKSRDLSQLASLRASIREQLLVSGLCDVHQFVSNLESAYQQMWRDCLR